MQGCLHPLEILSGLGVVGIDAQCCFKLGHRLAQLIGFVAGVFEHFANRVPADELLDRDLSILADNDAGFGHDAELVTGSVQHDQDAKRGGKIKKSDDGGSGFGTGGRRGRFD